MSLILLIAALWIASNVAIAVVVAVQGFRRTPTAPPAPPAAVAPGGTARVYAISKSTGSVSAR